MKQKLTASVWQEDEWFVAQCVEVDVASQGKTEDEALENLRDALEVHFTPPVATLAPQIRSLECGLPNGRATVPRRPSTLSTTTF